MYKQPRPEGGFSLANNYAKMVGGDLKEILLKDVGGGLHERVRCM